MKNLGDGMRKILYIIGGFLVILLVGSNLIDSNWNLSVNNLIDTRDERIKGNEELKEFNNIKVNIDHDEIIVVKSDKYAIEYDLSAKRGNLNYNVNNGTLEISRENKTHITFFSINTSGYIKIYIPEKATVDKVDIVSDHSDIELDTIKGTNLEVKGSHGDLDIKNSNFDNLEVTREHTEINLQNCIINKIKIDSRHGDISCENINSSGANIVAKHSQVKLDGNILGEITVESEHGDLEFELKDEEDLYTYELKCEHGDIEINDEIINNEDDNIIKKGSGSNIINLDVRHGNIDLDFK